MAISSYSPSKKGTVIIIGLSGPSSSGKTTLARLLRQVFNITALVPGNISPSAPITATEGSDPSTANLDDAVNGDGHPRTQQSRPRHRRIKLFILHEDDFYKTDSLIPRKEITSRAFGTRMLEDWDCIESIDLPLLSSTLSHIHTYGSLPPEMFSKEDQNTVGASGVSDSTLEELRSEVMRWIGSLDMSVAPSSSSPSSPSPSTSLGSQIEAIDGEHDADITICLLDGFLLYPSPESPVGSEDCEMLDIMNKYLDVKLFIPSSRDRTIERRTKRTGYVTLEGFWEDPAGYVEDLVWPNYRANHGWLFEQQTTVATMTTSVTNGVRHEDTNGNGNIPTEKSEEEEEEEEDKGREIRPREW